MTTCAAPMNDFTELLNAAENGNTKASEELLPLIYEQLRRIAAAKMAGENAGHTLQATALVHEAWIHLAGNHQREWKNRSHFFGAAAESMRRILVDHARRKNAKRRGSGVVLEELDESTIELSVPPQDLLDVHEALEKLAREDTQAAELVKLRYFVGFSMEECASALSLPMRTTERLWSYARAWLKREIKRSQQV